MNTIDNKLPCTHGVIKYIGQQEVIGDKKPLEFGNCVNCNSTIMMGDKYIEIENGLYGLKDKIKEKKNE